MKRHHFPPGTEPEVKTTISGQCEAGKCSECPDCSIYASTGLFSEYTTVTSNRMPDDCKPKIHYVLSSIAGYSH
jgi:hypothetical protein